MYPNNFLMYNIYTMDIGLGNNLPLPPEEREYILWIITKIMSRFWKGHKKESAELNGVKVNPQDFEMPRTTFDMLEQTCQIA